MRVFKHDFIFRKNNPLRNAIDQLLRNQWPGSIVNGDPIDVGGHQSQGAAHRLGAARAAGRTEHFWSCSHGAPCDDDQLNVRARFECVDGPIEHRSPRKHCRKLVGAKS